MIDHLIKFLGQTYTNLKRSEIAYNNYLNDEKKFIHAKILKTCNEQIRDLLLENSFLLSDTLQQDALKLISHYDIWIEKWIDLEQKRKPDLEDEFVFQNTYSFPKDASNNLENEYLKLKKDRINL
jgi:hypothetical protein